MGLSSRKTLILHGIETTEGTDPGLDPTQNAIQVLNFEPTIIDGAQVTRNIEKPYLGGTPSILTQLQRSGTFDMEMCGSGAATTPTQWANVARVCGLGTPTVSGQSVVSSPTSSVPSATEYWYKDYLLLRASGLRGGMGFTMENNSIPLFNFKMLGKSPSGIIGRNTQPTATLPAIATPVLANTANTTFMLNGYAYALRSFTATDNADIQYRSLIGPVDRTIYFDRNWTFSATVELPDPNSANLFPYLTSFATFPGSIVHGTVAGNIVQVSMPQMSLNGVKYGDEQGTVMVTFTGQILPSSAGNDEITFTSK